MTLRLLTYNVRSLRDDRSAVAALIREAAPDVVCVQEAPRFARWRTLAAELARASGLTVVTGGRPAGANLVLAALRVQVVSRRDVLLTKAPRLHQRGLATAVLRCEGVQFGVASMHLDVTEPERWRHLPEVLAHVRALGVPAVIAGDVNDTEGSRVWAALTADRVDVAAALGRRQPTGPGRRLDAVFADPALRPLGARVLDSPLRYRASDHWPLLVELDVRPAP